MFSLLVPCASCSAALAVTLSVLVYAEKKQHQQRQKLLKQGWQGSTTRTEAVQHGLAWAIIAGIEKVHMQPARLFLSSEKSFVAQLARNIGMQGVGAKLAQAGVEAVSAGELAQYRVYVAGIASLAGLLGGLSLSPVTGIIGFVAGMVAGWAALPWALQNVAAWRTRMVERHISEAIEVMCLGLRAGLSFERSLELYWQNFFTPLSKEFCEAQQTWRTGLRTRDEALRAISKKYDSRIFERVIEGMVRSLRFGSPLADTLEDLAFEARQSHRAKVEETVMKTPVKMMLPIGLFILPSMLLLVMGPVMLELINGF